MFMFGLFVYTAGIREVLIEFEMSYSCTLYTRGHAVFQKILSPLVILSREKTMVTKVISELKSISRQDFSRNLTQVSTVVTCLT